MNTAPEPIYSNFYVLDQPSVADEVVVNRYLEELDYIIDGKKMHLLNAVLSMSIPVLEQGNFHEQMSVTPHDYLNIFEGCVSRNEQFIIDGAIAQSVNSKFATDSPALKRLLFLTTKFPNAVFEYISNRIGYATSNISEIDSSTYGDMITRKAFGDSNHLINNHYATNEHLYYDIYKAKEIIEFFCIFLPDVAQNPTFYREIINQFTILGTFEVLKKHSVFITPEMYLDKLHSLMSFDEFNFKFNFKRREKAFNYIYRELESPGTLFQHLYNDTVDQRLQRLENLKRIYVFIYFSITEVPLVIEEDTSINDYNRENLFGQANSFNREVLAGEHEDLVSEVFDTFNQGLITNPIILEQIRKMFQFIEYIVQATNPSPPPTEQEELKFVIKPPIHPADRDARVLKVPIYFNNSLNPDWKFLALSSTEFQFTMNDMVFPSIAHFAIFSLMTNVLLLSEEFAYSQLLPRRLESKYSSKKVSNFVEYEKYYELYTTMKETVFNNRMARAAMNLLDTWKATEANIHKLWLQRGKNLIFTCNIPFLGKHHLTHQGFNFIGKYINVSLNSSELVVSSPAIVEWVKEKVEDMQQAVKLYTISEPAEREFIEVLYNFNPNYIDPAIPSIGNSNIEIYVKQFIGTAIVINAFSEDTFIATVKQCQEQLRLPIMDEDKLIDLCCKKIRHILKIDDQTSPSTSDEKKKFIMIINKYTPSVSSTIRHNRLVFFSKNLKVL